MTYTSHQPPVPKQGMSTGSKIALFGCGGLLVVGALLFGGCAVIGGAVINEADKAAKADAKEDKRAAKQDVKITSEITKGVLGRELKTKVKITNHGKKRANYVVEGEFLDDKGDKISELLATVENLKPGTSSTKDFGGALVMDDDLKGVTKGKCKIVEVTRDEWLAAN
jgi:hypothetical protein